MTKKETQISFARCSGEVNITRQKLSDVERQLNDCTNNRRVDPKYSTRVVYCILHTAYAARFSALLITIYRLPTMKAFFSSLPETKRVLSIRNSRDSVPEIRWSVSKTDTFPMAVSLAQKSSEPTASPLFTNLLVILEFPSSEPAGFYFRVIVIQNDAIRTGTAHARCCF